MKGIEHRFSIRRNVPMHILVNHGFTYSRRAKINNLSLSGALVERDTITDLPSAALVETVVTFKANGKEQVVHRLPANVVRVDRETVALQFRPYDDRAYTALVNFLYAM